MTYLLSPVERDNTFTADRDVASPTPAVTEMTNVKRMPKPRGKQRVVITLGNNLYREKLHSAAQKDRR
jgi:hypothetical protein